MDIFSIIITGIFLGIGLAMDAFSISLATGLENPNMKLKKQLLIASTFGLFQYIMPMLGYIFVSYLASIFTVIKKFLPFISLVLLCYIGIKLVLEGVKYNPKDENILEYKNEVDGIKFFATLFFEGIITSIDALSVGFTMGSYDLKSANIESIIIGITTFIICIIGIKIGKFFGFRFKKVALIFGGVILIIIGLRIFL